MALVIGTNCGFVTVAPTSDPVGSDQEISSKSLATKDTSAVGVTNIYEIGWWCDNATSNTNFEVGLYSDDGGFDPATLLEVERTNSKGTAAGWKRVSVNWSISASTAYWLGVQNDKDIDITNTNRATSGGPGRAIISSSTTLPSDVSWGADTDGIHAIYALTTEPTSGTNIQINIGDVWKDVDTLKINIGDSWKDVVAIKQNIGDTWKDVF